MRRLDPKDGFWKKLGKRSGDLVIEIVGTILAIGGIAIADLCLQWWIGPDKKFFDRIPVQWGFDAAHICVIARLIWRLFVPEKDQ
jgi:hypothetical protein